MQFTKLRLTGFKSFVDPTELRIEPGLTGIVGPNGCGKSNIVEALRWAMGETSAKQMRGGEMDDVIFSGTAARPARNIAEVELALDNSDRSAPASLNEHLELEVSRRIERGSGSVYRINGREARARDVHLLFADSATGARSPALVSQGRIGSVIAAKPTERRLLLEEAAGIMGLHSRRHDAELRLRAADTNLDRLEDVLVTLEAQLYSLKKQARQASRYRNLTGHIRRTEALVLLLRWRRAASDRDNAASRLAAAESEVTELTRRAGQASAAQAETAAQLPELRRAEAEAAARLHRLTLARDGLEEEQKRLAAAAEHARTRVGQITGDLERERALAEDARAAAARLERELAEIEEGLEGEEEAHQRAEAALDEARAHLEETETELARLTEQVAAENARSSGLEHRIAEFDARLQRLNRQADDLAEARANLEAETADTAALDAATRTLKEAEATLADEHASWDGAERERANARSAEAAARKELQEAEGALARLEAERQGLESLLTENPTEAEQGDFWPKVIDSLVVEPGMETALGAALGEDLIASTEPSAPAHWRQWSALPTDPALPRGCETLARFVEGPEVLGRRLAQIGVVASGEDGDRLSLSLRPGQRLVSRDGGLWRWDGYTVVPGTPSVAETRLKQRNRLAELAGLLAPGAEAAKDAGKRHAEAEAAAEATTMHERGAREAAREAETRLAEAREVRATLAQEAAAVASRLAGLAEADERIATEMAEVTDGASAARAESERLASTQEAHARVDELRGRVTTERAELLRHQSHYDGLERQAEVRRRRLAGLADELSSWKTRSSGAAGRIQELDGRLAAARDEVATLEERPNEIAAKRSELLDLIEAAESDRRQAADRLAEGETRLSRADAQLKSGEALLADAREGRVRAEAVLKQSETQCRALIDRAAERLDTPIEELAQLADVKPEAEPPAEADVERKLERLLRERETMGPVNLLAEQEANEIREQTTTIESEREDLIAAIARLRRGISELNREARQRLLTSFEDVNRHFQDLFARLYGGGRAHLTLIDADDPLDAGLEIMARPPGKRLQTLSLLSGGEQALTALALLFAVFLTNPAPICFLDEVDAPLDDANVDRFCTLIEELAETTETRFLIITHHRMTMARMDRLYGVAMAEQGISQLVSVDLRQAERLRATA